MGRGGAVEKPQDFGKVMGKLVRFCRKYVPAIIIALVLGAAGTICQIIGPDKLKDMTNEITKGLPAVVHGKPVLNSIDMGAVARIGWLLVVLYVGYALLSYIQSWMMATVTQRTAQELRESISKKINKLPLSYFDKVSYGDVLSRITNDVDAIGQTLGQSLGSLITSATLFVGALVMMFYNNWIMALCAIGSSIIGLIIMMVIMKASQKYFTRQQVALGDVNGHVEEMYAGHTIVKAYNGEADSIRRFERYNADLYDSGWKSQFLSGLMMPLMNFVGNFGYVVVCVVGAALAMDGQIEFGVIVAFMMYIRLFTQPLSQFAQAFQNLQRCAAASERVFGFLEESEMADESGKQALLGAQGHEVHGDVEFSHVRFEYEAGKPISTTSPLLSPPVRRLLLWARPVPVRPLWSTCLCASTRLPVARSPSTAWTPSPCRAGMCTTSSPWCCRIPGSLMALCARTSPTPSRALRMSRSSAHAKLWDCTTTSCRCRTATTPCSTRIRRCPPARSSCSPLPAQWYRTRRF